MRPPPLENGDRLHTREFLRRYQASPLLKKAQLIEGVVHMPSPVSISHGKPDNLIQRWLGYYETFTPGVECLTNTTVILDVENTVQPDALLRFLPARAGRCRENADKLLAGPPELVVEIAASSVSIELGDKFRAYQRNGVREYLVWRTFEERFDWFHLEEDEYVAQAPDPQGRLASRVFPGLQLDVAALLRLDAAAVLSSLQAGLDSPGHKRFRVPAGSGS